MTTFARPVFSTAQLPPPSRETKTPRSVPRYTRDGCKGSTTTEWHGMSGMAVAPAPSLPTQVTPPSVVFQTCVPPKVE